MAYGSRSRLLYPEFADDIPGYAKALFKLGYTNERRLAFMHTGDPVSEIKAALKTTGVLAKALVDEGSDFTLARRKMLQHLYALFALVLVRVLDLRLKESLVVSLTTSKAQLHKLLHKHL